ncbi:MAG: single-stranded DNA-binding protein [Bacteroidales bacterium]|jgi:single-strand DNA-binding protein|nr:single-stranded DNA-binding protein [Bacteroidales bacterium]
MSGINKVILVGYLGKDPEIRTFENGTKKASFSLATTEYRKDKDGNRIEMTEWHNIIMWRNLAELAEKYLSKGRQIYVEGRLRTRNWDDANGVKRYITEVEANSFTFLSPKENSTPTVTQVPNQTVVVAPPPQPQPVPPEPKVPEENFSDDLPF